MRQLTTKETTLNAKLTSKPAQPRRKTSTKATNPSEVPVRGNEIAEGTPGEAPSIHGTGFQQESGAVHPSFPDQGNASLDESAERATDEEAIRRRAYQIWEEEGYPEGGHERHWEQAARELRGERDWSGSRKSGNRFFRLEPPKKQRARAVQSFCESLSCSNYSSQIVRDCGRRCGELAAASAAPG